MEAKSAVQELTLMSLRDRNFETDFVQCCSLLVNCHLVYWCDIFLDKGLVASLHIFWPGSLFKGMEGTWGSEIRVGVTRMWDQDMDKERHKLALHCLKSGWEWVVNRLSILKKKSENKESHKTIEFQQNSLDWNRPLKNLPSKWWPHYYAV